MREGGDGLMLHEADTPYQTRWRVVPLELKLQDDVEAVVRSEQGQVFLLGNSFREAQRRWPWAA
ncbi:MAG TPA: hypothetical protein VJN44_08935 [Roseateles sp.]|nr:hypothetical protein [Roseateles sp.]